MLCDTLGITVLLEFERLQKELYSLDHNKQVMNLLEIRNTMEEEEVKGAFFCSFIVFQEMYRITARKNTRDHSAQSVILFQCNFRKEDKEQMNEKIIKYILKRSMEKLKNTALRLLRMGDLVSQFSENQLVILVLDCNYEDSILVAN